MTKTELYRVEAVANTPPIATALADLHAVCFAALPQDVWSASAISTLLGTPGTVGLVALDANGEAVGFAIGRAIADEGEVLTLCVSPAARRRGVGTALMGELRERLAPRNRILLEVATTNQPARRLYESLGYRQVGHRSAYYRHAGKTVDALVLASSEAR